MSGKMNGKQTEQQKQMEQKEYAAYVKSVTPAHKLGTQMFRAFLTGGTFCTIGQLVLNYAKNNMGLDQQTAGTWCSLMLVLLSVVLTGFHQFSRIAKWGGAGALVPITGFANSVASSAIEYKKEGWIFGVGCKIFTIAGPVILYGVVASWVLGVIYWIGKIMGAA